MAYFDYNDDPAADADSENITILNDLSDEEWQMIVRSARSISFSKNEILLEEGQVDDAVYILVSGKVEVITNRSFGRVKRIATIDEGSVFGEVAFFDKRPRSASIRATTAGRVLRISRRSFDKISAWNPKLAQQLLFDVGEILAYRFRSEFPYKV
ncbi:MAG: cyclic nucleotide-binding domain-containing protein [Pseudomonadota bacterium]